MASLLYVAVLVVALTIHQLSNTVRECEAAGEGQGEGDTRNNKDYILKTEIDEAISECGGEVEASGTEEFRKRSSRGRGRRSAGERNLNIVMERIHDYLRERSLEDSGSGEWDYGGGGGKKNTWEGAGDDKSSVDNVYQHDKRNNSRNNMQYGHNGSGNRSFEEGSGGSKSIQEQNSTRYNQDDVENNFDSRGARLRPSAPAVGIRESSGNKFNTNLTSEYHGTRSTRRRRSDGLLRTATQSECLSQCVFTNLKVVDDRGIPKEALFMKLLQETTTSQQMKILVEKQLKACFHQLAGESQDDGCSYSNALESCLGLEVRQRRDSDNNIPTTTSSH